MGEKKIHVLVAKPGLDGYDRGAGMEGLKQKGMEDVLVITGGIIPEEDIPALCQMGIKAAFGPGTPTQDIVDFINQAMKEKGETK